jgi:hypothetical protein
LELFQNKEEYNQSSLTSLSTFKKKNNNDIKLPKITKLDHYNYLKMRENEKTKSNNDSILSIFTHKNKMDSVSYRAMNAFILTPKYLFKNSQNNQNKKNFSEIGNNENRIERLNLFLIKDTIDIGKDDIYKLSNTNKDNDICKNNVENEEKEAKTIDVGKKIKKRINLGHKIKNLEISKSIDNKKLKNLKLNLQNKNKRKNSDINNFNIFYNDKSNNFKLNKKAFCRYYIKKNDYNPIQFNLKLKKNNSCFNNLLPKIYRKNTSLMNLPNSNFSTIKAQSRKSNNKFNISKECNDISNSKNYIYNFMTKLKN